MHGREPRGHGFPLLGHEPVELLLVASQAQPLEKRLELLSLLFEVVEFTFPVGIERIVATRA